MKNNKTKILIVALKYFPASGGSATYSYQTALGLYRQGYDVLLMAPRYRHREMDDSSSPFKIKRLRFIFGFDFLRVFIASFQIFLEYLRFKPDVIWSTSFAGCRTLGMLTSLNTKFIGTIHGGGLHRRYPSKLITNKFTDWLGMRFMNRAEALVTVSEYSKTIFNDKILKKNILKKTHVIYNSIDYDENNFFTRKDALKELKEYKNKKIILTVGRLVAAKGHDIVIESIRLLKKKFPDIIYIIVGEGIEKETLKKLVKDKKLEDTVIFTGYVSERELELYYALCDIFVMAGRWTAKFIEGFGLVYIEAGLRGKAVIGTNVGGIPEAIVENKTGFIVEQENPQAIADKIEYMLRNEKICRKMGNFASKSIKVNFSNEVMAKHNSDLIKAIMKTNK